MEKIELNVENIDGAKEIIYRRGDASPIELPEMNVIEGDINTIASFISKRYPRPSTPNALGLQFVDKNRAIVTVDKEKFEITLELDPEHPRGTVVKGKLSFAPELLKFQINTEAMFNREQLIKLIRFNKIFFPDKDQHEKLLSSYMAFSAEVNAKIGKESDTRGNVTNGYKKTVTTSVPDSFVLDIPVFKGQGKRKFRVEICIEATDASTRFWLESVELHDLIQIESEAILSKQLESCADFVTVWK
jgi:hypothetical protein